MDPLLISSIDEFLTNAFVWRYWKTLPLITPPEKFFTAGLNKYNYDGVSWGRNYGFVCLKSGDELLLRMYFGFYTTHLDSSVYRAYKSSQYLAVSFWL
jgi:hypothetical protein